MLMSLQRKEQRVQSNNQIEYPGQKHQRRCEVAELELPSFRKGVYIYMYIYINDLYYRQYSMYSCFMHCLCALIC